MDEKKKKNMLENWRIRAKFPNLKKIGKKNNPKPPKKLTYRRSISVPDLRMVKFLGDDPHDATTFEISPSPAPSDSDSLSSNTAHDGPLYMDAVHEPRMRDFAEAKPLASNRISAPAMATFEDMSELHNLPRDRKSSVSDEPLYTQVVKNRANPQKSLEPVPAPRTIFKNAQHSSDKVRSDVDMDELGPLAAYIARAHSMGEQTREKFEKKAISEKGTPLLLKRQCPSGLGLDILTPPVETDGTSLDSACETPSDEKMPWNTTDSEEQEMFTPIEMCELGLDEEETLLRSPHQDNVEELSNEQFDFSEDNMPELPEMSTSAEPYTPAPFQRYLLNINLKQGRNLVIRDKRSGTSDPYVKFKLEGKQFYKSKVVYKNLNPRWNESFSHPLREREHLVEVRVYDKNRTSDDFMGSSSIDLKNLELYRNYEMELPLDDPKSKEDDMGVIIVDVCLMFRDATIKRSPRWPQKKNKNHMVQAQRPVEGTKSQSRNRMWTGVLGVTLVEGQDLPQSGVGDVYVRFRLGEQKYKSNNLCIQPNPQWREQFDLNQFEDCQEPLQVEVCSKRGRKGEESWGTIDVDLSRLPLNEAQLYTNVLDPGKGRLVFLVTLRPVWGVSITDMETAPLEKPEERESIEDRFSLKNTHKCMIEVGFLQVKVVRANDLASSDINGKINPFCVVEVGNSRLQTHTMYKTSNPEWNKALSFPIKDIHEVIEVTVMDENGDNFLGKVAVPLLTIKNGQQMCLCLKKEDLSRTYKGTITLEIDVIYNNVRAGIKTFKPKETKLTEETPKFNKKVLSQNIYRVKRISTAVLYTLQYINSCFQWESTQRSLIAFLIFLVTVWHWELFMLPLFLFVLIGWNYFQLSAGKLTSHQDLVNIGMAEEDEDDEKDAARKGLMDKIHMVQEVVLAVQNVLEEIANIGERVKNIFNWSVPFVSCLACLVLFVATTLLYFFSLRYLVLIWGVNKFTKKLRNPYTIDNNEILDFLKRVPSDVQKVQYSSQRAPAGGSQPQRRKK
ncbi:multiple C2 and transmembrane domain-containing protein 2 isoform X2 [Boleophthalmus pectinirostris]|uniref:multiple C2 and transmembrane domain-containing protein 2 isoform X2 n=1 Tax=Boleophthalmus pectinirostris TaxID=150288 RepID=UPI0024314981|nr:multiple C2 and transmembrane domain-containing protein 2 isoform X2 [Boleophthalmus pectinirostris]